MKSRGKQDKVTVRVVSGKLTPKSQADVLASGNVMRVDEPPIERRIRETRTK